MLKFIALFMLATSVNVLAAALDSTASERFAQAEGIWIAHIDSQTDQDMLELMRQISEQEPTLKIRYEALLKNNQQQTLKTVTLTENPE